MSILKPNTESTVLDRLRIVIGTLLALGGAGMIALNLISGNSEVMTWVLSVGLVAIGLVIAASHKIMMFVLELFR